LTQTWQTNHVFISGTFRDMQTERDHLVRMVLPELRERMAQRRPYLIGVDPRWEDHEGKSRAWG